MKAPLRSFLFVPGDSEKMARIADVAANAFIFDLKDAVAPSRKAIARQMVPLALTAAPRLRRGPKFWVARNG